MIPIPPTLINNNLEVPGPIPAWMQAFYILYMIFAVGAFLWAIRFVIK